jgi:hypothetical protein
MRDFLDTVLHLIIGFFLVYWLFQAYMIIAFLVGINRGDFYTSIFPNNVAVFIFCSLILLFFKIKKIKSSIKKSAS